ncbi:MAG: VWA domain-containing protein, partial [Planctomycetes bacterium]|nr:VWA domain-containing protein [Planctomycetota bacterium]
MPLTIGNLLASARPLGIAGALLALAWFAAIGDSQEQAGTPPKIVLLFDVSASMNTVDGPVPTGVDPATLPSRQEQVVRLLTAKGKKGVPAFLDRLVQKAPVVAYRFGSSLDNVTDPDPDKPWSADEWRRWLKSDDRTGTNIAGAALRMLREEKDNSIQAIIIVSDGRSNHSTAAQIKEFLAEVNGAKPPIPVFTVGVGNPKPAPSIRIADLHAPETARPGQRFVVRVPIDSHGLANEQIPITLEASRVNDALGKPISGKKQSVPGPKTAQLKADGPTLVDFEIDLPALHKNAAPVDLLGTWQFTARTPRYPREAFTGAEHVSEPTSVVVQERKTRVLLFSGGPSREYQFLRTLLVREVRENRLDLSVLLQTGQDDGVEQEVDGDKLLKRFPDKLAGVYDVILSFDPDWTTLTAKQLKTLHEWVDRHGGGLLFSAGKVNTYRLARPGGIDLSSLLPLVPVVLMDSRLHGLGLMEPDATRPYPLRFASDLKAYPFLQLDEDLPGPTAGWNSFFWNNEKYEYDPAKADRPRRGFFTYYPVERIRPAATVVAGFAGPKESRIGERSDAFKDQQAFIVTMPFGAGKSMYLSAGEFWRLRQAKEGYHERFWLGIVRYLTAPPLKGRPF